MGEGRRGRAYIAQSQGLKNKTTTPQTWARMLECGYHLAKLMGRLSAGAGPASPRILSANTGQMSDRGKQEAKDHTAGAQDTKRWGSQKGHPPQQNRKATGGQGWEELTLGDEELKACSVLRR